MTTSKKALLLPYTVPFGLTEWCRSVLKPETFKALQFDQVSALQCLSAFNFAITNPKTPGTNVEHIPGEILQRHAKRRAARVHQGS